MVIGHGARFTVLSDTPIAAAIAGCVIPLSRNSTICMRWRCAAGIFHRSAVFSRRTSALLHLTICFPRIRWRSESHFEKDENRQPKRRVTFQDLDSSRYRGGITSGKIAIDETVAPVLDPGRGRTKKGYFWAIARDDRPWGGTDPPAIAYSYAPGRGAVHALKLLDGNRGIVQCDGYAAYETIADKVPGEAITLAFCWAHLRRRFFEGRRRPDRERGARTHRGDYREPAGQTFGNREGNLPEGINVRGRGGFGDGGIPGVRPLRPQTPGPRPPSGYDGQRQ